MVKMRQRHLCVFEFEQGKTDEILAYIQYNADFMRNRLLAFHTDITPEIQDFLHNLGAMPFKVTNQKILQQTKPKNEKEQNKSTAQIESMPKDSMQQHTEKIKITFDLHDSNKVVMESLQPNKPQLVPAQKEQELKAQQTITNTANKLQNETMPMEVFHRAIRSGEEIVVGTHASFFKDIHGGAFIKSYGNLHIYGKCNGILECFGDYIVIGEFAMGRISLQNVNLEGKMLERARKSKKLKMLTIENGSIVVTEL